MLNNCPFCNSKQVSVQNSHKWSSCYVVECAMCGATGPIENTKEKAREAWGKDE